MNQESITIRSIKSEDIKSVLEFMLVHFCRDEPLCSIEPKIELTESQISEVIAMVSAGMSIMAVTEVNNCEKLVGINIAIPISAKAVAQEHLHKAAQHPKTKYGQIMQINGIAFQKANICDRFGVDEIFYSQMSCVEPNYRGRRIGQQMKSALMVMGKTLGYPMLAIQCSGYYSACVVERLGWENIHNIAYTDYVDENGDQIFKPELPHVAFRTFVVRL